MVEYSDIYQTYLWRICFYHIIIFNMLQDFIEVSLLLLSIRQGMFVFIEGSGEKESGSAGSLIFYCL